MFNRSEIMKEAHTNAKRMMKNSGWAQHGYAYCFQYSLVGAWNRAKYAALTATEKQVAEIKSEIANLEYLPLRQNAAARRTTLQHKLLTLAA